MPFATLLGCALLTQTPAYLNPSLDPKARAQDLVHRMTLQEKVSQMVNVAPAIERLQIPAYDWWSESLHGPIGSPVTVFPQAIGLAATFDLPLMARVATVISDEGRARYNEAIKKGRTGMHEGLTFWAPNINIFRDPRWGRGQETYGEDPFLTGRMAVAYVRSMQAERNGRLKTVSTPKHYAVHSGPDPERHRFNAVVDHRDWWNTYLPAFKAAVMEGGAWSVMSAYSAVDGVPASANRTLLQTILRDKWGFRGYVVSDCGAIWDVVYGHKFRRTPAEGAAASVKAGTDLECGDAYKSLVEAVDKRLIDESEIDRAVGRLFEARIRLGMFDPPSLSPYRSLSKKDVDTPAHRALALEAARKSVVLLKNDGYLPLRNVRTLAVIGPNADDRGVPLGNYNGMPSRTVTVLEGIKATAPRGTRVLYAQGATITEGVSVTPVPAEVLPEGVEAMYFNGEAPVGDALHRTKLKALNLDWELGRPFADMPADGFAATFETTLVPKQSGRYVLGTRADDGTRVYLDGKLIVDDWTEHAARVTTAPVQLVAGRRYQVKVDYFERAGYASVALVWNPPGRELFGEAIDAVRSSDAVVMVLGISGAIENEERDRSSIRLPDIQEKLLARIVQTGKPVVVVLESGSCIALDDTKLRGLIEAWYPGEEGGTAVAEVLFGRTNPSARLPITFYRSLAQVPPFREYKMAGRTYRYMAAKPQYPFGYGLSYTRFAYSKPEVKFIETLKRIGTIVGGAEEFHAMKGSPWTLGVSARVRNVGIREGDEVVQVYASRAGASWPEPTRKLVGFDRVHLKPGESKTVTVPIRYDTVCQADASGNLKVVPGNYTFSIGGGQPGQEPSTSGKAVTLRLKL